jgi:hypothetical protein
MIRTILIFLLLVVILPFANASEEVDANPGLEAATQKQLPHVTMNIGVEISGLKQAAEQAAQGLVLIGESLDKIASNHDLTPEQHELVQQALARVDELGQNLNLTVAQLPGTVENSIAPMVNAGKDFTAQIRLIVILTAIGLVIIILITLVAVYHFVLAPVTHSISETAGLLNKLAKTLESTAKIVDKSSEQNQRVLEEMQKLQGADA